MSSDAKPGTGQDGPERLRFEGDRGAGRSKWIALAVALALAAWMGSGYVFPADDDAQAAATGEGGPAPVQVAVRESAAEPVTQVFVAEGEAEPERDTRVLAEATGSVTEVAVSKGAVVEAGQVLGRISSERARAEVNRAQEEYDRALREFENAQTLLDRGVATVDRLAQARAALAAAESQLTAAEEALEDTTIRAPFAGRVESLEIDEGEFVTSGTPVARVVDLTPLTVTVRVPQQELRGIEEGQRAEVSFITGETRAGTVSFVGAAADPETRTFAAEVEVANDDRAIPAGISAQVRIPRGEVEAHFLSPAILSLDPAGRLGIKTVTAENTVEFHPVEIVRAGTEGIWVTGLPDQARIITVGQGFVSAGEAVAPRPEAELDLGQMRDRLLETPPAPEGE
ncbi:efflux RND transporter periplasmic adaptor subunit [Rhodosalinus halophilus]|uniref:Efflux RND transporter periplasmic adaptor subunit n=1 Tax=Rhodosalinus halophilus TaxID=2259333 RepID=A0A365UAH4_9RHOB|nr:efflux RND transporter periplasmic adaptor subunit [Rhodosalinus halophilus]RBI86149.1 efflux RND transporter periplasmic adaptor subunit [Rhodosalinus halophilus]